MTAVCRMQMGCGDGYLGIKSSWVGSRQERRPGDGGDIKMSSSPALGKTESIQIHIHIYTRTTIFLSSLSLLIDFLSSISFQSCTPIPTTPTNPTPPSSTCLPTSSRTSPSTPYVTSPPPPPSHPPPTLTNTPPPQVPAAFALVMVPHAYGVALAGRNYDLAK